MRESCARRSVWCFPESASSAPALRHLLNADLMNSCTSASLQERHCSASAWACRCSLKNRKSLAERPACGFCVVAFAVLQTTWLCRRLGGIRSGSEQLILYLKG